jgi:hypothetical protein
MTLRFISCANQNKITLLAEKSAVYVSGVSAVSTVFDGMLLHDRMALSATRRTGGHLRLRNP